MKKQVSFEAATISGSDENVSSKVKNPTEKIFLIMKLTGIILLLVTMHASAASFAQKVTLVERNSNLKEVFKELRRQTGYFFIYNDRVIRNAKLVTVNLKDKSVAEVLQEIFKGQRLNYSIRDKIIIVTAKHEVEESKKIPPINIKGKISAENGESLPGATIKVEGTNQATVSDPNGEFSFSGINNDAVLIVTYAGFITQAISVTGRSQIEIILKEDLLNLSEVVVVGYGTQKKVNLTGAVNQIDSKAIADRPVANLSQALQGVSPNLNITFNDGHPGSGGTFNIRGFASITNTGGSPLILIDGVPGDINTINPHDVDNISVLKDAASSAIYGARGAFGVILVTTKQGQQGQLSVTYNTNFSMQNPTARTDFMTDGYTQARLTDEAFLRTTGASYTRYTDQDYEELRKRQTDPSLPSVVLDNRNGRDMYIYYGNTDWWQTFFRNTQPSMEHALNITGGSEKIDFLVSGRYYEQKGIMQISQDKYNAYNFRAKINARISPWLSISGNTQFSANDYTYPGLGYNSNFVSTSVHALASYVPVNPDGTATFRPEINSATIGDGLFANLLHDRSTGNQTNYDFMNTVGVNLNVVKGLTFTGNYTYDLKPYSNSQRRTRAPWSVYPGEISYVGNDQLTQNTYLDQYHAINAYGNYEKSLNSHNFKVTAGYNQELRKFHSTSATRINLLSESLNELDLGTGDAQVGSNASEWGLLGFFGRINYDFKSKYLLEVNGRYDGSSRFPAGNRFGFFPSVSAGWRISEENFFQPVKSIISDLKLRGSYGSLGNQQISSSYPYIPVINSGIGNYISNGSRSQYLSVPNPVDPDFTWEKAATINGGIDLGVFKNRLVASADVYQRKTTDMITNGETLPAVFGASSPQQNAADLITKGFDLSLNWNNSSKIAGKEFSYNLGVVLSDYTARINRFNNPGKLLNNYYEGQQVGEIWGYSLDGYFTSDEEAQNWPIDQSFVNATRLRSPGEWNSLHAGDIKFKDINGDNVVNNGKNTADDQGDLTVIGNRLPRYSYGINGGFNWSGFDVSFLFQGVGKQDWYPGNNADKFWGFYSRSYFSYIPKDFESKIWSPENPDAYFPLLRAYTALNAGSELNVANDKYIQNLAYIRLKNLTVGYNIPQSFIKNWNRKQFRIYFSGQNLFTLTKLNTKYIDPEQAIAEANGRVYPFFKIYSFGLNISI